MLITETVPVRSVMHPMCRALLVLSGYRAMLDGGIPMYVLWYLRSIATRDKKNLTLVESYCKWLESTIRQKCLVFQKTGDELDAPLRFSNSYISDCCIG